MRERAGYIVGISGVVLLLNPNLDPQQVTMYMNDFIGTYWPAALIVLGLCLVNPRKKKTRGKSR